MIIVEYFLNILPNVFVSICSFFVRKKDFSDISQESFQELKINKGVFWYAFIVDFILTGDAFSPFIATHIFCVVVRHPVEAKNDNLDIGGPQCIAEMYASKVFNEQKNIQFQKFMVLLLLV